MTILCEACFKKYYSSAIRECPRKPGHYICLYCCRKCKRNYTAEPGSGCTAWDEMKKKEKEGSNDGGSKK